MDNTEDPNVMKECKRLRLIVRGENAAVSAGGFFFITKDYAATVCLNNLFFISCSQIYICSYLGW